MNASIYISILITIRGANQLILIFNLNERIIIVGLQEKYTKKGILVQGIPKKCNTFTLQLIYYFRLKLIVFLPIDRVH